MGRYIDANGIRIVAQMVDENGDALVSLSDVRRAIEQTPTADVVEVRHGVWEKASEYMPIYRCSVCKERNLFKNGDNVLSNYCPNCGAEMDENRQFALGYYEGYFDGKNSREA